MSSPIAAIASSKVVLAATDNFMQRAAATEAGSNTQNLKNTSIFSMKKPA